MLATQHCRAISGETAAKTLLVQFLIKNKLIPPNTAIAMELGLAKYTNRADLALIGDGLHLFEIKSRLDSLERLPDQIRAYEAVSDNITVVAHTKHLNNISEILPDHVGILEIIDSENAFFISSVRAPKSKKTWNSASSLDLLPAIEIRKRIFEGKGPHRRSDLIKLALDMQESIPRDALIDFLKERYMPTTNIFLRSVRRRNVKSSDLNALRIWRQNISVSSKENSCAVDLNSTAPNQDFYLLHVGDSFGPVPDDIKEMLNA